MEMGLLLVIFIILAAITTFIAILYFTMYSKLKYTLKHMYTYNRIGMKEFSYGFKGNAQVEYEEIERFKNGLSRVRIINIEVYKNDSYARDIKKSIKEDFKDVQDTEGFTWLERDEDLMDIRRKKLERLIGKI